MGVYTDFVDKQTSKKLDKKVEKILDLDSKFSTLSDEELKQYGLKLQERAKNGESKSSLLVEAFAVVRETSYRVLGMKHYPVQLKGGIAIAEGNIAEMATGEGKTLVAPLAAYLHALDGKNVHVITSNEYLAERDSTQMKKLFGFLGMEVGLSVANQSTEEKQKAYAANITYTTNSELGFDYLRDNRVSREEDKVMRGLNAVIIDEADDTLIDTANMPLIMSSDDPTSDKVLISWSQEAIKNFVEGEDYIFNLTEDGFPSFSEQGIEKLERFFNIENLFTEKTSPLVNYLNNALKANVLFKKDVDYIVVNNEVKIVDKSTGRILENSKFSNGIHQAIEAKEGVTITKENLTCASINYQSFFKLYENVSGMTGTCKTDEEEIREVYDLNVVKIETNRPLKRVDKEFDLYLDNNARNIALKQRVEELIKQGRPILIGTTSVEKSIEMSNLFKEWGFEHNLLNATNHKEEGKIIAQAGRVNAITIATNMAGRGTDIMLGGNPTYLAKEEMEKIGFSKEIIEFADSHYPPKTAEQNQARDTFIELKSKFKLETDSEKNLVQKAGGLAVIGTELNNSRRVDNQLRGRAGRQGEAGSSEFIISLEDVLQNFTQLTRIEGLDKEAMATIKNLKEVQETHCKLTGKKTIDFVKSIQATSESLLTQSRKTQLQLSVPENIQRMALYSEREEFLKMCSDFTAPEQFDTTTITEEPSNDFEAYVKRIYERDITSFVSEYYDVKKYSPKLVPQAREALRNNLLRYGISPNILTDEIINESGQDEIISRLLAYTTKIFKAKVYTVESVYPGFVKNSLKNVILEDIDLSWSYHLEKIQQNKRDMSIKGSFSEQDMLEFFNRTFHDFNFLKDSTAHNIIAPLNKCLVNKFIKARNLIEKQSHKDNQLNKDKEVKKELSNNPNGPKPN